MGEDRTEKREADFEGRTRNKEEPISKTPRPDPDSQPPSAAVPPASPQVAPASPSLKVALLASGAVFAGMFAFYAVMANRYPIYGDTPELMTASINLGIAHPSGYPLLTLLGKGASLLPLGTMAYRMNLLMGLFGALTAGGICLLVCLAFGSIGAGVIAGLGLGLTPVLWESSTNFEVYALHAMLIVALLLLTAKVWVPTAGNDKHRRRYFYLLALVIGLGISHRISFATTLPVVAWIIFRRRQVWLPGRGEIIRALLLFVLGLTPWLYLPIRASLPYDPYTCWAPLTSVRAILDHITARQYGYRLFAYSLPAVPLLAKRDLVMIWEQFGLLLIFVPFGLAAIRSRGRVIIEAGLLLLGINLVLFFGYFAYDYDVFFVPTYIGLTILIAAGIVWLGRHASHRFPHLTPLVPVALAVVFLAIHLPGRYAHLKPLSEPFVAGFVHKLSASIPSNAVIIIGNQFVRGDCVRFPLLYAKRVTGEVPGLAFRTTGHLDPVLAHYSSAEAEFATRLKNFLEEIGTSANATRLIMNHPVGQRVFALMHLYDGPRPIFTDSPKLVKPAGLGAAYCGYLWRVLPTPGFELEADPDDFVEWVRAEAGKPGANDAVHENLAIPLIGYGYYLTATGQHEQGVQFARILTKVCHKSREALFHATSAAIQAHDHATAWQMLRRLQKVSPHRGRTYYLRGTLLFAEKKCPQALAAFNILDSLSTEWDPSVAYMRALCYLAMGDPDRARKVAGPVVWPSVLSVLENAKTESRDD